MSKKFDKTKFKKFKDKKVNALTKNPKKRKIYKKQKCVFVSSDGISCKKMAIGKGMFCAMHGGKKDKDNLIPIENTENYMALHTNNSKFKPAYHPVSFIDYSREGLSDVEIAAEFEISVATLKRWADTYELFQTAYEIGQALHEAWWLQKGKDNLTSRFFNTKLFKFLTSNKLGYSDKMETKSTNTNVHGVLVIPATISSEDWKIKAQKTIADQSTLDAEYTEVENVDEKA